MGQNKMLKNKKFTKTNSNEESQKNLPSTYNSLRKIIGSLFWDQNFNFVQISNRMYISILTYFRCIQKL